MKKKNSDREKNLGLLSWFYFCLLGSCLLLTPASWGQFKKFRSRTQLNTAAEPSHSGPEAADAAAPATDNANANANSNANGATAERAAESGNGAGGSEGGIATSDLEDLENDNEDALSAPGGDVPAPKKDNKFVNLNPETAFGPEVIESFDFPNSTLLDLTKHMQKLTGLNLILDKDVKGKISILAPTPITVGDAWKAYLTTLNLNGYTLVKSGAFYKVIQTRDARYTPTKIYTGTYTPNTENYVMRIIPLKNVDATEITRSFRPFMTRYGRIIEIKQTNTLIVHDTGENINRLVKLVKFIDVPGHEESLQIIPVRNSSAQEIANLLDNILRGKGTARMRNGGGMRSRSGQDSDISKLIAEPRTNSIIAMANAEGARQLRELINKLDVKLEDTGDGQIQVYYLNYGDADELSKTLSTLVSASKTKGSSRFTARSSNEMAPLFNSEVKITADKANNALVVMASPTDYLTIKKIIAKLDIPRDQVYVEGLIMETGVNSERSLGINIIGAYGPGGLEKFGFTPGGSQDLVNLLTNNITSLSGLFVGLGALGSRTITMADGKQMEIKSVNGLIKAIAADNQTNVLATPQILALDNEDAVFEVGETVPTLVREVSASGSSITSTKEQKVTLTLKITPQINKISRVVKLKINQKIDDFSGRQTGGEAGVGTITRSAITTVIVKDRDTIAMGGLMRDKTINQESKVPLLGDIPVLGWLFKSQTVSTTKMNLLFFLTPKILAPYEKTAAKNTRDLLNRRNAHLHEVFPDGKDPFSATVKGLYDKSTAQEKKVNGELDSPNYQEILDEVHKNKSPGQPSSPSAPKKDNATSAAPAATQDATEEAGDKDEHGDAHKENDVDKEQDFEEQVIDLSQQTPIVPLPQRSEKSEQAEKPQSAKDALPQISGT